jgi:hypothetical protein
MVNSALLMLAGLAAQASASCTRSMLEKATAAYLKALAAGDPSKLSLSEGAKYAENNTPMDIAKGIMSKPIMVDFDRTLYDTMQCSAMVEIDAATSAHPYVIHTQMHLDTEGDKITKLESVVTDEGDWSFNATAHLSWNKMEKWDTIPEDKRDSRQVIQAALDAYLDNWAKPDLPVPHGTPCARLEGGAYTGDTKPDANTCDMGAFPEPINVTNRRYVIDETLGAVDVFNDFPWLEITLKAGESTPSSNMLRVQGGKVRYIHELTVCNTPSCGRTMPPPPPATA